VCVSEKDKKKKLLKIADVCGIKNWAYVLDEEVENEGAFIAVIIVGL
jgi:hypothetical protein